MTPHELLGAQRPVHVLAVKPGVSDERTQYWSLKLAGLHQEHLKSAVDLLRKHQLKHAQTPAEKRSLKSLSLLDSLARALGAASYTAWHEHEQPKILALLAEHGMTRPADLIKWAYPPFCGALKARQVSDRLFNSGLPMPHRLFTGVGSNLFAPSGYGRLDIDAIAGQTLYHDEQRLEFCREHLEDVLLRATQMRSPIEFKHIDMTGRTLMLNAVSEHVDCAFNLLGDNLSMPVGATPTLTLYNASETELSYHTDIFELFRQEIERSAAGWVDVVPVPGNDRLVLLKGADGAFDWVVRDQRDVPLTSNPLYPFFDKDELPTAMDTSQIEALRYFTPGQWQERLEHDAETRHYADGGSTWNWPGYEKLVERELMAAHRVVAPKRITGPASDRFVSHRLGDYRLMVSPLITIDQFNAFADETGWTRTRMDRAAKASIAIERDLSTVNGHDAGDLPASVTWLDAIAYCRDYENRHDLPVRLLEPEEWTQIAPPPSVVQPRVAGPRLMLGTAKQRPLDPVYEQLKWAVVGGDGQLGKNSAHCEWPEGFLSFVPGLTWQQNSAGLPFLWVAGFREWLSGYHRGRAPFARAVSGVVTTGAGIFGSLEEVGLAMRHEGVKVGFRLCYVAHADA